MWLPVKMHRQVDRVGQLQCIILQYMFISLLGSSEPTPRQNIAKIVKPYFSLFYENRADFRFINDIISTYLARTYGQNQKKGTSGLDCPDVL